MALALMEGDALKLAEGELELEAGASGLGAITSVVAAGDTVA